MSEDFEQKLRLAFAEPERPADEAFTGRVRIAILAEERMRAQRRALGRRALEEGSAALVLILSFVLLVRASPDLAQGAAIPFSSPILAGLVLLALGLIALATTRTGLRMPDPHQ
jgi:hypothetical protein